MPQPGNQVMKIRKRGSKKTTSKAYGSTAIERDRAPVVEVQSEVLSRGPHIARLFDAGVAAYRHKDWRRARLLLAQVIAVDPQYERDGHKASALLANTNRGLDRSVVTGAAVLLLCVAGLFALSLVLSVLPLGAHYEAGSPPKIKISEVLAALPPSPTLEQAGTLESAPDGARLLAQPQATPLLTGTPTVGLRTQPPVAEPEAIATTFTPTSTVAASTSAPQRSTATSTRVRPTSTQTPDRLERPTITNTRVRLTFTRVPTSTRVARTFTPVPTEPAPVNTNTPPRGTSVPAVATATNTQVSQTVVVPQLTSTPSGSRDTRIPAPTDTVRRPASTVVFPTDSPVPSTFPPRHTETPRPLATKTPAITTEPSVTPAITTKPQPSVEPTDTQEPEPSVEPTDTRRPTITPRRTNTRRATSTPRS